MNISYSDILFLVSCFLIAFSIIGVILLRMSSAGNKPMGNVVNQVVLRHQNRTRIAVPKADKTYQQLRRDKINIKITFQHDSLESFYKKEEMPNMRREYAGNGENKITA